MSTTNNELEQLKELIISRFDKLESRLDKVDSRLEKVEGRMTALEIGQAELKGKISAMESSVQKIPDLAEKMGELKNWKQIAVIFLTAIAGTFFGLFIRGNRL